MYDRDWRFVLEAIRRINSIGELAEFQRVTLEQLMILIACDQGTFFLFEDPDLGSMSVSADVVVVGQPALYMDEFRSGEYDNDPYFRGMQSLGERYRVFRDSEILPETYRESTRLYRDIYKNQGIYWGLRAYLVSQGRTLGNISLFNSKRRGDFADKEKEILGLLEPHITLKLQALLEGQPDAARKGSSGIALDDEKVEHSGSPSGSGRFSHTSSAAWTTTRSPKRYSYRFRPSRSTCTTSTGRRMWARACSSTTQL